MVTIRDVLELPKSFPSSIPRPCVSNSHFRRVDYTVLFTRCVRCRLLGGKTVNIIVFLVCVGLIILLAIQRKPPKKPLNTISMQEHIQSLAENENEHNKEKDKP